jgi:glycosyltransferase involved in cell wall biosynthesis
MTQFGTQFMPGTILWWGRFDPDYSRNRIVRQLLLTCGYRVVDFRPRSSLFGSIEAFFSRLERPDAVWVPTFRHRDFPSARRFADRCKVPLVFDPLISSWDKVVFERRKYSAQSRQAQKLFEQEREYFSRADLVIADTQPHARFYIDTLSASEWAAKVVPVGAEEHLFKPSPTSPAGLDRKPEILFYGSFISLQGPEIIVEAARQVPEANWTLLGEGPLRNICENKGAGCPHIRFEKWLPYERLAERISRADILLGIFGESDKAGRVIPNKAYQALACGRPLVTRTSPAYPAALKDDGGSSGITFVNPNDPGQLAEAVRSMQQLDNLSELGQRAHATYRHWFSGDHVKHALKEALAVLGL